MKPRPYHYKLTSAALQQRKDAAKARAKKVGKKGRDAKGRFIKTHCDCTGNGYTGQCVHTYKRTKRR